MTNVEHFDFKKFFSLKNFKKILANKKTAYKAFYFDIFISILIIISCTFFVMETHGSLNKTLSFIEYIIMFIFTVEFILRNYFAKKKREYFFSVFNLLDLLAIFPFVFGVASLQFLRVFRVLKIIRYVLSLLDSKYRKIGAINTILFLRIFMIVSIMLYVTASLFYTFEYGYNDKVQNISDAFYIALLAITKAGFLDIVPKTQEGKFLIIGVILFALFLIPLYVSSLMRSLVKGVNKKHFTCKACGFSSHDENAIHCKMCGELLYHKHTD